MKLSNLERETIILWNEAEKTGPAFILTAPLCSANSPSFALLTRNQLLLWRITDTAGLPMSCRKNGVKVVPPRILSPAQREVLDRMNRNRHGKQD